MHRIGFALCLFVAWSVCTLPDVALAQETAATAATAAAEAATTAAATTAEATAAATAEAPATYVFDHESPQNIANTLWTMIAGFLVFFMNLGFGCVEAGMCRAKNCVNILSKNFVVFAAATLAYWFVGFGLMFGDGNSFFGTSGLFMLSGTDGPASDTHPLYGSGSYDALAWATLPLECKFFFQLVFAGTAATIVSGAVAERIKYGSFIVFVFLLTMFVYPVTGHWIWGGGWLAAGNINGTAWNGFCGGAGFWDFAGSTTVHSVGGWAALAGMIVLGPRIGKYSADGKVLALPGHNMSLAFIGVLVLWLGWFGFNPGSTMGADVPQICHIAMTTNMAAVSAIVSSTAVAWGMLGKPDIGMTLNGCLAGLVAITAPCPWVSAGDAVVIGLIAGALVVFSVIAFDKAKIDDPVGATSVHLANGIFGTLAIGIWGNAEAVSKYVPTLNPKAAPATGLLYSGSPNQLLAQIVGILAVGIYVFAASLVFWLILKYTMGIRVSKEEEVEGLDVGEHGNEAYPNFVISGSH